MHDMKKMQNKDKTQPPRESHNLKPKMARVGVTNMASYIWGVTTLHHYEIISSRDLGLKELWIFGTEVVLAFPGGFLVGMV